MSDLQQNHLSLAPGLSELSFIDLVGVRTIVDATLRRTETTSGRAGRMSPRHNLRRIGIAVAAAVACLAPATPASAVELSSCSGAYAEPTAGFQPEVRRATLCLLNEERTQRGLDGLRSSDTLQTVAQSYAQHMVTGSFFDHVSPTGSMFVDRIKSSEYLDAGDGFYVGENLAWGAGPRATPERIVSAWMDSPDHRANVLSGRFRDIGIGVVVGVPVAGGGQGATYVTEFGMRS